MVCKTKTLLILRLDFQFCHPGISSFLILEMKMLIGADRFPRFSPLTIFLVKSFHSGAQFFHDFKHFPKGTFEPFF